MNEDFFNNINGYALDKQQKEAILNAKKYSLIVAGAGSGKTLTMVGKIKYLTQIKKIKPEEILCISFTNESTKSLKEKVNIPGVNIFTFHKLAIHILNLQDIYYELCPENYLKTIINDFFTNHLWNNKFLKKQWQKITKKFYFTKKSYQNSLKTINYKETIKLMETFINLFNTNNLNLNEFKNFFTNPKNNPLLYLIYSIIHLYEKKKYENHYFDFDDLIKKAIELETKTPVSKYKEIIVDEFQDTSILRLDLVRAVVNSSNASLTVVGDDFQSIYKFSGCNLNIFLNFKEYFPGAETFKIENTYRNSQELINVAGDFVMKNNRQIHKDLKSHKNLEKPIKIINYFNKQKALLKTIQQIKEGEILILGRNNFDIYEFISKEKITWLENGYFKLEDYNYNLRYLTVHKSKGLESDNVIIINLENKELGFPCLRKNAPLTNLIQEPDKFLYEEERRLFYVAITRTKNYCYLLVPFANPSVFAIETKKYKEYVN